MTNRDEFEHADLKKIQELFSNDGLKAPEEISQEAIMDRLENSEAQGAADKVTPIESSMRKPDIYRMLLPVAAALLVALVSIPLVRNALTRPIATSSDTAVSSNEHAVGSNPTSEETAEADQADTLMASEELITFRKESEIKKLVKKLDGENSSFFPSFGAKEDMVYEEAAEMEFGIEAVAETTGESASANSDAQSASQTYLQVEGVDEADIVKTDGDYIYHVTSENEVVIWQKQPEGLPKKVSTISDFEDDGYINSIFLQKERLITVGYRYRNEIDETYVVIFDITDPKNPSRLNEFSQSGYTVTTRLTGGKIYLVTNDYVNRRRFLPYVTSEGAFQPMEVRDICAFPEADAPCYVIVSAIDASGKEKKSTSKALFGAGETVYCNTEHLFIARTKYIAGAGEYAEPQTISQIARIDLNDGAPEFARTGKVRGYVYGQFALDEKDGYLRVASTGTKNGRDVNYLTVLDEEMKQVGLISGFAKNEHIEAVRFMGDKGYIITFERTDPLFILDLKDPRDPKIEGEVKIDGFSSLLVPIDKGRLIGIGYSTEENEFGGIVTNGLKLALFDISDPAKPTVLDSKVFEEYASEAQYDHHALLKNDVAGYLAIPYEYNHFEEDGDWETRGGFIAFSADDKIEVIKEEELTDVGVRRCIYIDESIYSIDGWDEIFRTEM